VTSVLVVDDDPGLGRALRINLSARGYEVTLAADGASALALAARHRPDLVVLDLGLPDMDGTEVLAGLRGWSTAPVIVLSARDAEAEKVRALDAGADDYVTKPFGLDELLARLRAAERRARPAPDEPQVVTAAFTVDLARREVTREGSPVRVTATEWGLLEALARHPGRLVTQQQLLEHVWGPGYASETHYLRVHMAALRRKLEPEPGAPRHLVTEPGQGYRLRP
jgi:two-component system KDP operon response regulator KdpE